MLIIAISCALFWLGGFSEASGRWTNNRGNDFAWGIAFTVAGIVGYFLGFILYLNHIIQ